MSDYTARILVIKVLASLKLINIPLNSIACDWSRARLEFSSVLDEPYPLVIS